MDESQTRTSTTLLEQVAVGDDQAAGRRFVERYGPMIRAIASACRLSPQDVEDVTQEVLMAAVDALRRQRYDRERGRFKPWFKAVIYHKINDVRDRNSQSRALNAGEGPIGAENASDRYPRGIRAHSSQEDVVDPSPGPHEQFIAAFEAEWQKVAMEEALDEIRREIDPVTFQAFDLYARKNRPPGEVAKLLGLSRNAVYIAKTRVMGKLREILHQHL